VREAFSTDRQSVGPNKSGSMQGLAMHRSRPIYRFDTDCQSPAIFHELFPSPIRLADLILQRWELEAFVDGQRHEVQPTFAPPQHGLCFLPEPQGHSSFRPTLVALRRCSVVRVARYFMDARCAVAP